GYTDAGDPAFVQCFDAKELERLRHELGSELRLIQLIGENRWQESDTDYDQLRTGEGLAALAKTADGIGPGLWQLYTLAEIDGQPVSTGLVSLAHAHELAVHPYTFRADELPPGFETLEAALQWFAGTLGIDGLFTDFPDRAIRAFAQ
ncbi:MAG: glycerophosphodiester phosphodiesterase family protein, partial [Woeseiaceae bacterium]